MKTMKKVLAIVLALSMIFALSISAQAATIIDDEEDTDYLALTISAADDVSYKAVTVEGGEDYDDVTTYSYYATFPSNFSSLSSVSVTAEYPTDYVLYLDSVALSAVISGDVKVSTFNVDFTTGHVLELYEDDELVRTFQLAGGIDGAVLAPIYMAIDVSDAVDWVFENGEMDSSSQAALDAILAAPGMNRYTGEMATAVISNVPAGSTAMDVLFYLCYGAGNSGATIMCGNSNITANGLGLTINGTGYPISYVSGIGTGTDYLSEFSTEFTSGWLYRDVDGFPNYGAADYYLIGGESFTWIFVNNFMDYIDFF